MTNTEAEVNNDRSLRGGFFMGTCWCKLGLAAALLSNFSILAHAQVGIFEGHQDIGTLLRGNNQRPRDAGVEKRQRTRGRDFTDERFRAQEIARRH